MGLFDSVYVNCPNCGAPMEFQSKAGQCTLKTYSLSDAPPKILASLADETFICDMCMSEIQIKVIISAYLYIKSKI